MEEISEENSKGYFVEIGAVKMSSNEKHFLKNLQVRPQFFCLKFVRTLLVE